MQKTDTVLLSFSTLVEVCSYTQFLPFLSGASYTSYPPPRTWMLTFSASRGALLFAFNFPQNYNAEKETEFQEVSLSCIIWNGYTNKDEENRLQFYTTLSNLQINTSIYIYVRLLLDSEYIYICISF